MDVSLVIRTKGIEKIPLLLNLLSRQTCKPSEIIVVNNGVSLNLPQEITEIRISDKEFTHMYSTNLGVSLANNELVCITNGHSLPLDKKWLENGIKCLKKSRDIAGVSGLSLPKNLLERGVYTFINYLFLRSNLCTVCCIIRKSLWYIYPFDEDLPKIIPETKQLGGEDFDWELEMKHLGYRIVLEPKFSVFHSHYNTVNSELERNLKNYFLHKKLHEKIRLLERPRKSFTKCKIPSDA